MLMPEILRKFKLKLRKLSYLITRIGLSNDVPATWSFRTDVKEDEVITDLPFRHIDDRRVCHQDIDKIVTSTSKGD